MATVIPLQTPASFVQGETVKWRVRLSDYDPVTWTLLYAFVIAGHKAETVTATNNGDGTFLVTISATASKGFSAGEWRFQAYVSDGSERFKVADGRVTVERDFANTGADYDARSDWQIVLDAIMATIKGTATVQQSSMSIGGRSLSERSVEELLMLEQKARAEVERERKADAIARGENPGGRILVRL